MIAATPVTTAPITFLSLPDSDEDHGIKSDLSNHNCACDWVADTFNSNIEDTLAHSDDNNAGSSDDSRIAYTLTCDTYSNNADSSSNNNNIVYNPGGISSNNTFTSAKRNSSYSTYSILFLT